MRDLSHALTVGFLEAIVVLLIIALLATVMGID